MISICYCLLLRHTPYFRRLFCFLLYSVVVLAHVGCGKEAANGDGDNGADQGIHAFYFLAKDNAAQLTDTLQCTISQDSIIGYYPLNSTPTALVPSFELSSGTLLSVDGVTQNSGLNAHDFSHPVTYQLSINDSTIKTYVVVLKHFTGLPIMYLQTDGGAIIYSKNDGVVGAVSIDANGNGGLNNYTGTASFFLHGNTTLGYPKKPYKVKLDSKSPLLGMPTGKSWILLANYDDKTLLRNYVAFQLGKILGMSYVPNSQFVELVLNGEYLGNYQLTEKIDVDSHRLNIHEMTADDNSGEALTGGYLIEADNKNEDNDEVRFNTSVANNSFIIHFPDPPTSQQVNYIQSYFNQTEATLYGSTMSDPTTGYRGWIDPTSFVQYFWVNELARNNDAGFWSSTYLYKDRDSLLNMGPIWDFDMSLGNVTFNDNDQPAGWWIHSQAWFEQLFTDDYFKQLSRDKWQQIRSSLDILNTQIDAMAAYLDQSQKENFKKWNIMNVAIPNANSQVAGSYAGEIDFLKSWLSQRIAWIDANLNTL